MGRSKAPDFGKFWTAYPVHKDKASAERAWSRLSCDDRRKAVAGIPAYREECLRTGVAMCYGQGYLARRRWEDEPSPVPAGCPKDGAAGMEKW